MKKKLYIGVIDSHIFKEARYLTEPDLRYSHPVNVNFSSFFTSSKIYDNLNELIDKLIEIDKDGGISKNIGNIYVIELGKIKTQEKKRYPLYDLIQFRKLEII